MAKLAREPGVHPTLRTFAPIAFGGSSRLTFKRLRRPTALPTMGSSGPLGRYLGRLNWLFGGR